MTEPTDHAATATAAEPNEPTESTESTESATEDFDLGAFLTASVPMVRALNLEFLETTAERAVLRLPDQPEFHNHLAAPHAGAMFTLAESASGAVVLAAFGDQLSRAVPLTVHVEMDYRKLAKGDVVATAELVRPVADVVAELDAGERPNIPVTVRIERADGAVTGEMKIIWTLRLHR